MPTHQEHTVLLGQFREWTVRKEFVADVDLMGELIQLRQSYDELEPSYWPSGSVEHLLIERWPSKGPTHVPEEDVLRDTLHAWFRFLRSTGRMSARSADLQELARETRRAARRMSAVASDRASWSSGKAILDFGRTIGIQLDDLDDAETLQERLDEVTRRWNDLPVDERRRLMPDPSGATGDITLKERLMRRFGEDDPIRALLADFYGRLPGGELPQPAEIAPAIRETSYLRQLLALRDWIGDGQELTTRDLLRVQPAHDAYEALGLGSWVRGQLLRQYPDERLPGVAAKGHAAWIEEEANRPWRSAGDCEALHRLWFGAHEAGLVGFRGRRVVAEPLPDLTDDDVVVDVWSDGVIGLFDFLGHGRLDLAVIVQALMTSYVTRRSPVPKSDLIDFYMRWIFPTSHEPDADSRERFFATSVDAALGQVADTGLLDEDGSAVTLTEAGEVFVSTWLHYLEDTRPRAE